MHYLLFYETTEDYMERRKEFRSEHLTLAWKSHEEGKLILGGALADPVDSAIALFKGDSPAVAEQFAREDPYVRNGLVKRWWVREWITVVGKDANAPTF